MIDFGLSCVWPGSGVRSTIIECADPPDGGSSRLATSAACDDGRLVRRDLLSAGRFAQPTFTPVPALRAVVSIDSRRGPRYGAAGSIHPCSFLSPHDLIHAAGEHDKKKTLFGSNRGVLLTMTGKVT
jgi:hypothetical protein